MLKPFSMCHSLHVVVQYFRHLKWYAASWGQPLQADSNLSQSQSHWHCTSLHLPDGSASGLPPLFLVIDALLL